MTFNLRFENDFDGENCWQNRRDLVVSIVEKYRPSILGTQEGTVAQLEYLGERLAGYRLHAPARRWDKECQYPTLFYHTADLDGLEGGEFWLSETPEVHRSKSWDSAFPRMMSFGLFNHLASGRKIWAAVTHLDHIGPVARIEQARMVARWISGCKGPKILMGDFNDTPGSEVHKVLTAPETGMRDVWEVLGRKEDEFSITYHKFLGKPVVCRMDWILASLGLEPLDAAVVRDSTADGRYPSDHFPYAATFGWSRRQQ